MEAQILEASRRGAIEGSCCATRLFYGSGNPMTAYMIRLCDDGCCRWCVATRGCCCRFIHLDDAVAATIAALETAPASSAYDIVDDQAASMSEA